MSQLNAKRRHIFKHIITRIFFCHQLRYTINILWRRKQNKKKRTNCNEHALSIKGFRIRDQNRNFGNLK